MKLQQRQHSSGVMGRPHSSGLMGSLYSSGLEESAHLYGHMGNPHSSGLAGKPGEQLEAAAPTARPVSAESERRGGNQKIKEQEESCRVVGGSGVRQPQSIRVPGERNRSAENGADRIDNDKPQESFYGSASARGWTEGSLTDKNFSNKSYLAAAKGSETFGYPLQYPYKSSGFYKPVENPNGVDQLVRRSLALQPADFFPSPGSSPLETLLTSSPQSPDTTAAVSGSGSGAHWSHEQSSAFSSKREAATRANVFGGTSAVQFEANTPVAMGWSRNTDRLADATGADHVQVQERDWDEPLPTAYADPTKSF